MPTASEWTSWLHRQIEVALAGYVAQPRRLLSDGNAERDFVGDYEGRQLLELMQNAADAATKAKSPGHLRLELSSLGLIAANTGATFSPDGVSSLLLPHTSPKALEQFGTVGKKGLGFRSLLNWTRSPLISSGSLSLAFTEENTRHRQTGLAKQSPEIRRIIEEYRDGRLLLPLLAVPGDPERALQSHLAGAHASVGARIDALRADGFDTVVCLPFADGGFKKAALLQLERLRPEAMLFALGLQQLIVTIDEQPFIEWQTHQEPGETTIETKGKSAALTRWRVLHRKGKVPPDVRSSGDGSDLHFDVAIAVPVPGVVPSGPLFCYFPTEVSYPYPVVCHATLDLISNRQQLQQTKANGFVLRQAADLLVELAESQAQGDDPLAGLRLVTTTEPMFDPLHFFGHGTHVKEAARLKNILPTVGGNLVTAAEARRVPFGDTSWLPAGAFENVVKTDSDRYAATLESLNVAILSPTEWQEAIGKAKFGSFQARAAFIAGMIRNGMGNHLAEVSVLLDQDGASIPADYRTFLSAGTAGSFPLPEWYRSRFLHPELVKALGQLLEKRDQDALVAALNEVGVVRYSLDAVAGGLVAEANRRSDENPELGAAITRDLVGALHTLFKHLPEERRPAFPSKADLFLPAQDGSLRDASEMYLGETAGTEGYISQDLYGRFAPERLVGPADELGLAHLQPKELGAFLSWVGVDRFPRDTFVVNPPWLYLDYIKEGLHFPVASNYELIASVGQLGSPQTQTIHSLDRLEEILKHAPSTTILAWLASDPRANDWKIPSKGHGRYGTSLFNKQNVRWLDAPVPSFAHWKLSHEPWLPVKGTKVAPSAAICTVVTGLEEFLPVPLRPGPDFTARYGLSSRQYRDAFDRAGVLVSFAEVDVDRLYHLLLELPVRDPEGKRARSVYRAVLDNLSAEAVESSEARARFVTQGKIWIKQGEAEKYHPVSEAWHIDSEDIDKSIAQKLPVAAISKRSGNPKVQAVLGVRCLTRDLISRKVTKSTLLPVSEAFQDDLVVLKPAILAMLAREKDSGEFRKLTIALCSKIEGTTLFQGETLPLEVEPWGWIMDDKSATAYILCDPEVADPLQCPLLADTAGQILASSLRLERGEDIARLISSPRQYRLALIRRIAGDEAIVDLAQLQQKYVEESPDWSDQEFEVPTGPAEPEPPNDPPLPTDDDDSEMPAETPDPLAAHPPPELRIESQPHKPTEPKRIELKVARKPRSGTHLRTLTRVTNGEFCERKVLEFEAMDDPPRFPLLVSGVTGWASPGVDIISFATEADRASFLSGEKNVGKIVRFIEVKGRASVGARIDLKGNALEAARRHRTKYYLYRLFVQTHGNYDLAILGDPLADDRGAKAYWEINLDAATGTQEFMLSGGLKPPAVSI